MNDMMTMCVDQDGGKAIRKRAPPSGRFSATIRPPMRLMMPWLIDRPRPVPLPVGLVVKNGSNRRGITVVGNARPIVVHGELHAAVGSGRHAHGDAAERAGRRAAGVVDQGVARIEDEIDQDLLELVRVALRHRPRVRQVELEVDAGRSQLLAQQVGALAHRRHQVERHRIVGRLVRHAAQGLDQPGGALDLLADLVELAPEEVDHVGRHRLRFGHVELFEQALGRHADHGKRLVELVRHAGGHVAEMGDARRIEQPDLGLAAVGVVDGDHHDVAQAAGFILDGISSDLDDALGAVGQDHVAVVHERLQAFRADRGLPTGSTAVMPLSPSSA